jgi:hypothetical protein
MALWTKRGGRVMAKDAKPSRLEGPAIPMPGPQITARGVRSSLSEDGEPLARVRQVDAKPSKLSKKGD